MIGAGGEVRAVGPRSVLPGNVELRVSVADALGNPVSSGRFVEGETVLVKATLSALEVLDARAAADRLQAQMSRPGGAGPERTRVEEEFHAMEGKLAAAGDAVVRSPLGGLANRLRLTAEVTRPARAAGTAYPNLVRLVSAGPPPPPDAAHVETRWSFDSSTAGPGTVSVLVQLEGEAPAAVTFDVVPNDVATGSERCRAAYAGAHLALEAKRYKDAADLAATAVALGEPLEYHRMAALHVLGDAQSALGNRSAALAAYRDALQIAVAAFPKSALPAILGSRVQELLNPPRARRVYLLRPHDP